MVGSFVVVLFLFYVLRFSLTMGIVRAQYSKCHPRHFFISRRSLARLTEIGRCFVARYKRGKRDSNLNKQLFLVVGSSLVVHWFVFSSSLVFDMVHIYKVQGNGILIIVLF